MSEIGFENVIMFAQVAWPLSLSEWSKGRGLEQEAHTGRQHAVSHSLAHAHTPPLLLHD